MPQPSLNPAQVRRRDEILAEFKVLEQQLEQKDFDIKATAVATGVGAFFTFGTSLFLGGSTAVTLCNSRQQLLTKYETLKSELRELQGSCDEATYQPSKEIKDLVNPKRYGGAMAELGMFAKQTGNAVVGFGKDMLTAAKKGDGEPDRSNETTRDQSSDSAPSL